MVLPGPQRLQRGKVDVGVPSRRRRPPHARDVDAHRVGRNLGDGGAADARLGDAQHAHHAVKEPHGADHVYPQLVDARVAHPVDDVVPAADDDKDGQDDVEEQKHLVRGAAQPQDALGHESHQAEHGYDAPDPVGRVHVGVVLAQPDVGLQHGDGVDDGVGDAEAGDPAVEQNKGGKGPVGQPQQDVVAGREEDRQREQGKGDVAGSVADKGKDLARLGVAPRVGKLKVVVRDGA